MNDPGVTIFHNPACGTSRTTLQLIRDQGIEPRVVEYLKTGWTVDQLKGLLAAMGKRPADVLRAKEQIAQDLGLASPDVSDDALLTAMAAHPVLVERPIVQTPRATVLARPSDLVLSVLKAND